MRLGETIHSVKAFSVFRSDRKPGMTLPVSMIF